MSDDDNRPGDVAQRLLDFRGMIHNVQVLAECAAGDRFCWTAAADFAHVGVYDAAATPPRVLREADDRVKLRDLAAVLAGSTPGLHWFAGPERAAEDRVRRWSAGLLEALAEEECEYADPDQPDGRNYGGRRQRGDWAMDRIDWRRIAAEARAVLDLLDVPGKASGGGRDPIAVDPSPGFTVTYAEVVDRSHRPGRLRRKVPAAQRVLLEALDDWPAEEGRSVHAAARVAGCSWATARKAIDGSPRLKAVLGQAERKGASVRASPLGASDAAGLASHEPAPDDRVLLFETAAGLSPTDAAAARAELERAGHEVAEPAWRAMLAAAKRARALVGPAEVQKRA